MNFLTGILLGMAGGVAVTAVVCYTARSSYVRSLEDAGVELIVNQMRQQELLRLQHERVMELEAALRDDAEAADWWKGEA